MSIKYELGDVRLISLQIINSNSTARIDLRGVMNNFSIYEDINEPTVYAEIYILDALNLVNDFPIKGEETVEIVFATPFREKLTTYNLKVFAVEGSSIGPAAKTSAYVLKCVSLEHFLNEFKPISQSYNDTISNIVNSILKNNLATEKKLFVEETKGINKITIPRMRPFAAVDYLKQRAVSTVDSGGVFVFFENQYGLNFKSIEGMYRVGKDQVESKIFTYSPNVKSDPTREALAYRNIISLEFIKRGDTVKKLTSGAYKSVTQSFDITTKAITQKTFNFEEQSQKIFFANDKAKALNSVGFIKTFTDATTKQFFMPVNSSLKNDGVADLISYRNSFMNFFNDTILRAYVYGDNYLVAGDVIEIRIPEVSGTTSRKTEDKTGSGFYLVTKLRHYFAMENKRLNHRISFECNKLG